MRNHYFRYINFMIVLAGFFAWSISVAEDIPDKKKARSQALVKTAGAPEWSVLNINNFVNWVRRDAPGALSPHGDNQAIYPRGSANAIYTDGFYFGGKAFNDVGKTISAPRQTVRIGGKGYSYGLAAGWVNGQGGTAVAVPPTDAAARIYRIRRDYTSMSVTELRQDAAEINEIPLSSVTDAQVAAVKLQYDTDWKNWPVTLGAPYVERNGTPGFQAPTDFTNYTDPLNVVYTVDSLIAKNQDEPGIAGADPNSPAGQVIWTVANDLNVSQSLGFNGSEPLGLELQFTVWGYKRADALGQLFFKKIKMINKGGVDTSNSVTPANGVFTIDSMYVCLWSDVDLGSFTDDLAGCDSTLSMGYVYNGNAIDETYNNFGYPPPATGYDFLAGPIVPALGDSAVFDLKKRYGVRNLPMSSFAYFSAGSPYSDPCNNSSGGLYNCNTFQWWKMLRGYAPIGNRFSADVPYSSGPFPVSNFPLSGDPAKGTGFLDGLGTLYSFVPGDRRILLNTGPFSMLPGDTQEVVLGVVAGLGSDRASSVAVMKFNDRYVQNTYNALFSVPAPPLAPDVKFAELDGQVALEWGSNLTRLSDIENRINQPGSYTFEGYNIYQLPSRSSPLSGGKRILTYDKKTDPTVVLDEQFDQTSGQILFIPVQYGSNSGLKRYFKFDRDYIKDIDKLYNGQEYYLVITAYSVSAVVGYLPSALESTPLVYVVRPKVPFGKVFTTVAGDTLPVVHTAGTSDGVMRPIIINPGAVTGDTYEIRFDTSAGNTTWRLRNATRNTTVVSGQTNQSGDDAYNIMEGGVILKVEGPAPGMKQWSIPAGARRFSPVGGFAGLDLEGFGSAGDQFLYDQASGTIGMAGHFAFGGIGTTLTTADYRTTLLRLAAVPDTALWQADVAPADVNFSRSYRWCRAAASPLAKPEFAKWITNPTALYPYQGFDYGVPFSAWDMEANPPARLMVGHFENNVLLGNVDGRYWPFNASEGTTNVDAREFAFIFKTPYSTTDDVAMHVPMQNNATLPLMWVMVCARRNATAWPGGDEFLITAAHVNGPTDVFTYVSPAPGSGVEQDKVSAGKVGVFPNPYYAFNAAETNRFSRFVTFNNLPPTATIRIFNVAGQLVRVLTKDPVSNSSEFMRWDLLNRYNFPVASGMYIAHVEMTLPSDGSTTTKILKLAVIQEQEILDSY